MSFSCADIVTAMELLRGAVDEGADLARLFRLLFRRRTVPRANAAYVVDFVLAVWRGWERPSPASGRPPACSSTGLSVGPHAGP